MLLKSNKSNLQNIDGTKGLLVAGLLNFIPVITTEKTKSLVIIEMICKETDYFNNYKTVSLLGDIKIISIIMKVLAFSEVITDRKSKHFIY